jgi:hypothetical protein
MSGTHSHGHLTALAIAAAESLTYLNCINFTTGSDTSASNVSGLENRKTSYLQTQQAQQHVGQSN